MNIVFFEVQEWERALLFKAFPESTLVAESLTEVNASKYVEAEIISTFIYSSVPEKVIVAFRKLKLIVTRSTGFDHVDVAFATKQSIAVANVPEYGSNTVAEHTFALILSLTRRIPQSIAQMKQVSFTHDVLRGIDIFDKTLGIVGLGKIGRQVMRIAQGFGMQVFIFTKTKPADIAESDRVHFGSLEELLSASDIVTLHLPLTEGTKHIINNQNIMHMKRGSYLINTARGGLIETEAILSGLNEGILDGVGIDVLEGEKAMTEEIAILAKNFMYTVNLKTLLMNHILINHPKVIITPHNAFNSREALARITETTIHTIDEFTKGKLINQVKA